MPHVASKTKAGQGIKPYPEYPLTPHKHAKQWCKKINGKICYFGRLAAAVHDELFPQNDKPDDEANT